MASAPDTRNRNANANYWSGRASFLRIGGVGGGRVLVRRAIRGAWGGAVAAEARAEHAALALARRC
eukprot:3114980-Lingulodinium_polyedra.AAC.1